MASNQDLSTTGYNLQTGSHLLTNISLPRPGQSKCVGCSTHSLGSSLPQASPLLSPAFSSPEESMQQFLREDDRGEEENERVTRVEEENRCLRGSVQNLKEQNERIRVVVGTMRKEMEALQKITLEGAAKSKTVSLSPEKGDIEEMKKIRDEVNIVMKQIMNMTSELQQVQQMKPNLVVDQQPLQHQQKIEHKAPLEENVKDVNLKSIPYDGKEAAAAKIAEMEKVQQVLRTQLESAIHDVMRMANERDLLMEISNSLHADFNRSFQQEKIKPSALTVENPHYLDLAQNPSCTPKNRFHERRRKVASTSPCSRTSMPRPSTSPSKSLWRSETEQGQEERCLLLQGRMTLLQERPDLQQDFFHKGTPSQRSKLQASIKRQEAQMENQVKVRNYNIKDDDM